jgi:hypothetical protein
MIVCAQAAMALPRLRPNLRVLQRLKAAPENVFLRASLALPYTAIVLSG